MRFVASWTAFRPDGELWEETARGSKGVPGETLDEAKPAAKAWFLKYRATETDKNLRYVLKIFEGEKVVWVHDELKGAPLLLPNETPAA